jgi:hypothetical protein
MAARAQYNRRVGGQIYGKIRAVSGLSGSGRSEDDGQDGVHWCGQDAKVG